VEIKIPIEKLKNRKLFVATPMFGGNASGIYTRSIADLSALCTHYGIQVRYYYLFQESLIQRARAYCCDEFLRSGDTHMLFIDADIGFSAQDVIAMLALQSENADEDPYDVVCGPYPKKMISWEKITQAVNKGLADENPQNLEKYVGDYVFNPANGTDRIAINEPTEVLESGTGFMMIRRNTFEKYMEAYPHQSYKPDHVRTDHFDGSREIFMFFDTPIDNKREYIDTEVEWFMKKNPKATHEEILAFIKDPNNGSKEYSKRYLSEDYAHCQAIRNIGLKVWLLPWMQLQHVGTMVFGGSLADLAQLGASATADPSKLKKKGK
jgi:hypothetical protein